MDWVILITALQILAVMSRSIENVPCNRVYKSKLSLNQTKDTNNSSAGDMKEFTNLHDENCTSDIDSRTSEDQNQDQFEDIVTNRPGIINNDDPYAENDEDNSNNINLTHKYDMKTTKREKAVIYDRALNQRSIIKESNTRNGSGYISTDDIRRAMRRSNNERSKSHPKTEDSKIYVFKDTLHPVYQIKRLDRNDLRSIKFNKTPKITILRKKSNNKQVINKINEESSSQNNINVNKKVTEVRKNLLDHLLEYFIKITQEAKNKGIANGDEVNINVENKLGNHYDSHDLDNASIDESLISDSSGDKSLHSDGFSDELINNVTDTSISEVAYNAEENYREDFHQEDVNQNDNRDAYEENVINDQNLNNNDSITESYTDIIDINNTHAEIINAADATDISASSDDISITENMNSIKTNTDAINNTKSSNEIDIDLNIRKFINILLENVDYTNGTTIDIDIPLNMTESPIIMSTNADQNRNEISDFNETTSSDVTELNDEIYNAEEVKQTSVEYDDNDLPMETTAEYRSTLKDDDDVVHTQEQTRSIHLGILDKDKIKKDERDGNEHIEENGNCDKRFKMRIDINVF